MRRTLNALNEAIVPSQRKSGAWALFGAGFAVVASLAAARNQSAQELHLYNVIELYKMRLGSQLEPAPSGAATR
jgi:hypothetical protein